METSIAFHKVVASGNDFILVDNREKLITNAKAFAQRVCDRHHGIGADGVLLLEPSLRADFFMRIVNSDGSEAEACGNGYRCVGLFVNQVLHMRPVMDFETLVGNVHAEVSGNVIKVQTIPPSGYKHNLLVKLGKQSLKADFINTGVPHVVIFSEGLDELPVKELGRTIRYHHDFKPKGTNVNFVEITGPSHLRIRTYERGVEDETLACGTGSIAAAICAVLTKKVSAPVTVETKSGDLLKVYLEMEGKKIKNVFLEGGARIVFEGKLNLIGMGK